CLPYRLPCDRHWRVRGRRAGLGGSLRQGAASVRLCGHAQVARAWRNRYGRLLVLCWLMAACSAELPTLTSAEAIVGSDRLVAALGCDDLVEDGREHDAKNDIRCQCIERGIARHCEPVELQREYRGLEPGRARHPGADHQACRPADQERPWIEPAGVE